MQRITNNFTKETTPKNGNSHFRQKENASTQNSKSLNQKKIFTPSKIEVTIQGSLSRKQKIQNFIESQLVSLSEFRKTQTSITSKKSRRSLFDDNGLLTKKTRGKLCKENLDKKDPHKEEEVTQKQNKIKTIDSR